MSRISVAAVCVVSFVVAACSARPAGPVGAATPVVASEAQSGVAAIDGAKDGIRVTLRVARDTVEPGGSLDMAITVRNERSEPATIGFGRCGIGATVYGDVAVPWEPAGRTWDGIEGEFKKFALEQGLQPGGVDARLPVRVDALTTPCPDFLGGPTDGLTLAPGESTGGNMRWTAAITYDPPVLPSTGPCDGPCSSTIVLWKGFSADGSLSVTGDTPPMLAAGEAIDKLLEDREFMSWLRQMKSSTWSNVNVFLWSSTVDGPVLPRGPFWDIELFREMGVPRNFALAFVDPFSGALKHIEYCNEPCDR
jgi:hypothetical protein